MVARKIDHLTGQVKTMSGRPLLHDAAQYGDVEQAEEQLRLGADLNGVDGSTGVPATPLWISAQRSPGRRGTPVSSPTGRGDLSPRFLVLTQARRRRCRSRTT